MVSHSVKVGLSFGLNSGVITTLGLMVGLYAGTQSQLAVIGGIITIAIADAFSDALGIHVSEESEGIHTEREIWESTIATFLSKLIFSSSFILPMVLLPLKTAVLVSIFWGLFLVAAFSYHIARERDSRIGVILEHLAIAVLVIIITYFVGLWVDKVFG